MRLIASIIIGLILVIPGWAMRPLSTDDAGTLGQQAWEIEEGFELDKPREDNNSSSFATSIKYGLFSSLDLGIEIPYSASSPSGMGDATLKGKIGFSEAVALGIDIKLANAESTNDLGTGYVDYGINGIYSQGLGAATAHFNIGYTIVGQAGGSKEEDNVLSYGAAVDYPYSSAINLMAEIIGSSTPSVSTNPLDMLIGLNWGVSDVLTLDGGASLGLTDASSEYRATLGATLAL